MVDICNKEQSQHSAEHEVSLSFTHKQTCPHKKLGKNAIKLPRREHRFCNKTTNKLELVQNVLFCLDLIPISIFQTLNQPQDRTELQSNHHHHVNKSTSKCSSMHECGKHVLQLIEKEIQRHREKNKEDKKT